MRRTLAFLAFAAVAVAACSQRVPVADIAALHDCADLFLEASEIESGECRLDAAGQTMRVSFSPMVEGVGGTVTIDVLNADGAVAQTIVEEGVSQYLAPTVQDVDGDGRADILVARETGNVNTAYGIWIFSGDRNVFRRVGEVSGYDIARTQEGLIAVQARSGAALRNVAFYQLNTDGLVHIATVELEAREGGETVRWSCRLSDAPGAAALGLAADAAEQRFCADPMVAGAAP
jgi:hypothetical protein